MSFVIFVRSKLRLKEQNELSSQVGIKDQTMLTLLSFWKRLRCIEFVRNKKYSSVNDFIVKSLLPQRMVRSSPRTAR